MLDGAIEIILALMPLANPAKPSSTIRFLVVPRIEVVSRT